jgi:GT2 family glycosyltransferase
MERILLGQLGANGDCLYATILARQLRADHPEAHIVWAISNQCAPLVANNPHIDEVWEIPIPGWEHHETMWRVFEREALARYVRRDFDRVLLSQIWPNNFQNYDGTIRPSILRSYGRPITVPIENVVNLSPAEIEKVETFARQHRLDDATHKILFECSSKSGQSFVTPKLALEIGRYLYRELPDARIIFSTNLPMKIDDRRSLYAGELSLRELAHLTHHCSLFVGSGSGGSVMACSTAAKPLPMIQLLSASTSVFASFAHDMDYFGIKDRQVLEMTNENPRHIALCIAAACKEGISSAMAKYDSRIPVRFDHYFNLIEQMLLANHRYIDAAHSLMVTAARFGWRPELVSFGRRRLVDRLALDPRWLFSDNRRIQEELLTHLNSARASSDLYKIQNLTEIAGQAFDMLHDQRRLELYKIRLVDDPKTVSEVRIPPEFLERAQAICTEEIGLIDARIAKDKIPFPKKIPRVRQKFNSNVQLESTLKLENFSRINHIGISEPSPERQNNRHNWRRFLPWKAHLSLARVAYLGRNVLETSRPGPITIVGARPETYALAKFLRRQGRNTIVLSPGYGAGTVIAPGYLMRPERGSLVGWVLDDQKNLESAGAIVFLGDGDFTSDADALSAAHHKPPVLFARREDGGEYGVTAVYPDGVLRPDVIGTGKTPLRISIVIVSFNQAAFLEAAIRSVVDQNYPNLDLIIVDGGSTDGSVEIIERYRPHFTHVVIEHDEGQSDALNKGFSLATGEVLNWLCSDDLLESGALRLIEEAYGATQADLIVGGCMRIGETRSEELYRHHTSIVVGRKVLLDPSDILKFMQSWQNGNYFFQPEVFFSRRTWEASGGFIKKHLYYAMDYDLWLRMALAEASIYHIPAMIACSRVHAQQKTLGSAEYMHQILQMMEEYQDLFAALETARVAANKPRPAVQTA